MKRIKSLFVAMTVLASLGASVTTVVAMVKLSGTSVTQEVKDDRVIIGHRIGSNGQEILIFSKE